MPDLAAEALRKAQRGHSFVLLNNDEFAELTGKGKTTMPGRHREHFQKSMRRKADWRGLVGDGAGNLVDALISEDTIEKTGELIAYRKKAPAVTLVQAWVKQKALALILQKSAEVGVARITLVGSDYASAHSENTARMESILENACMQAFNPLKPGLSFAADIKAISWHGENTFFGDLEATLRLREIRTEPGKSYCFFNGPEGGWSPKETAELRDRARGVLISENVLRAETAAIIAAGILTA